MHGVKVPAWENTCTEALPPLNHMCHDTRSKSLPHFTAVRKDGSTSSPQGRREKAQTWGILKLSKHPEAQTPTSATCSKELRGHGQGSVYNLPSSEHDKPLVLWAQALTYSLPPDSQAEFHGLLGGSPRCVGVHGSGKRAPSSHLSPARPATPGPSPFMKS